MPKANIQQISLHNIANLQKKTNSKLFQIKLRSEMAWQPIQKAIPIFTYITSCKKGQYPSQCHLSNDWAKEIGHQVS